MPILRTAAEISQLKNKIVAHIRRYFPDIRVEFVNEGNRWAFAAAYYDLKRNYFVINERILPSWSEEDIFDVINHEIAHAFSLPEYEEMLKERYGINSFKHLTIDFQDVFHDEIWQKWARILGAKPEKERYDDLGGRYDPSMKRYKMRCASCDYIFYTSGETRMFYIRIPMRNSISPVKLIYPYTGEDMNHAAINHDVFYVEDMITGRRGKINRYRGEPMEQLMPQEEG